MGLAHAELARLAALLDEALDLPAEARAAWLAALPAEDAPLRPHIEAALAEAAGDHPPAEAHGAPRATRGSGSGHRGPGPPQEHGHDGLGGQARHGDPRHRHAPDPLAALDALPRLADAAAQARLAGTAGVPAQVGPYRLLRPLGHGGMGAVWLAERVDGALQREVALKLPHASALQRPGLARRFARERDILAGLAHPHIARLYDAGVTPEGQPWLAMEVVAGQPITAWCDAHRLPLRARVDLFLQVLDAVQYAHGRLVVHRDLKPSNILVTAGPSQGGRSPLGGPGPRPAGGSPVTAGAAAERPALAGDRRASGDPARHGQVRLLDFGIATLLDDGGDHVHTEWAQAPMTPDYASPEQIAGQPIGTASDVYSLGVVFYELITGQRPYRLTRDSRGALEDAILATPPTRPSRSPATAAAAEQRAQRPAGLRRQLRGDLDNIALMALRKDPARRYPSAEAFRQDLQRWLRNKPVHAHPGSWGYRAAKFMQRHKLPVAAIGLAGAGMLAGLAVALDQAAIARREAQRTRAVQDFLVGLFNEADPARAQGRELTVRDLMARGERDLQAKLSSEPDLNAALSGVLIDIYKRLGDVKRALPLAEARRDLMARSHGTGSLAHALALQGLAGVQMSLGQHEASLATLALVEPMLTRHGGAGREALSELCLLRANNLLDLTRYAEGRALLQAELPAQIRRHGEASYEVALTRVRIATSYASSGLHAEATRALTELAPQLQRDWANAGLGGAHLRADAGYALWQLRRFPEAIALLQRAITEFDRLAGPRNALAIQATRTLGMAFLDAGQYARADATFADNVARSRAFYGEHDSETALNLSFSVMTLLRAGRDAEAAAAARAAVAIAQAPGATLSASEKRGLRRRLAAALALNGEPAAALAEFDALVAEERAAGQRDTRHAATLMLRAVTLGQVGRHAEALAAAEGATAAWAETGAALGPAGRIGVARAQLNHALVWLGAGRPAHAGTLIDSASTLLADGHGGADHPERQLAAIVRAQWLRASGRPAEADTLERAARARYAALAGLPAPEPLRLVP